MTDASTNLHYFRPAWIEQTDETLSVDLCVYGGTAAGVIAARSAVRQGISVVLLQPGKFLGGMTTGGLGWTDYGKKDVIGGLSRQFYLDLGAHYGREEEWHFEPGAAAAVMKGYIEEGAIPVRYAQYLDTVVMEANRIRSIRCLGGLTITARFFLDTTYEGDLMAKAGVRYHVGREDNQVYGETINGVQVRRSHQFSHPVDPYVVPGDPSSGVLPFINQQDTAREGAGDTRIQAYNFRVCMTDDPDLIIPWEKPAGFDERDYELARRWFLAEKDEWNEQIEPATATSPLRIRKFDILTQRTPGGFHKTDTNNHGAVSSDFIGANHAWPDADYSERERIFQAHVAWQQGFYWFAANHPDVPGRYQEAYGRWGLSRDEYPDTGHWPHQIYVREARRMVSDYVLNENDTQHRRKPDDPIGMGSYNMDSHNCQRFIRDGRVMNEGDVQLPPAGPYGVSYRSIVPSHGECGNLAVPVCLSASHIAFGSVRMEPAFMVLAESAVLAVKLALDRSCDLQEVPFSELRPRLWDAGQVI